jgi:hypothetical protein
MDLGGEVLVNGLRPTVADDDIAIGGSGKRVVWALSRHQIESLTA